MGDFDFVDNGSKTNSAVPDFREIVLFMFEIFLVD